ncbi:MAG TPA: sulfatase-like hydrolase/transferase, partial [Bryobacteraceae bacterium]|nr:sulfatase-like hydrolase/transferase [Bryobacteraceae bacterium]
MAEAGTVMANQTRADFLRQLGLGAFSLGSASAAARPNLLIIVTDDQGYADMSAYSHAAADVSTPHMDRIAAKGLLFTRAYVTAPVCSPSRAGWNTGRYQQRWDLNLGQT